MVNPHPIDDGTLRRPAPKHLAGLIVGKWYEIALRLMGLKEQERAAARPAPPQLMSGEEIVSVVYAAVERQHWHTAATAAAGIAERWHC